MTATYSHVGRRGAVGHYAVTGDATRTPGKAHALNPITGPTGRHGYLALCGVHVAEESDDHFVGSNPVIPAVEGRVTCKRCRKALGA